MRFFRSQRLAVLAAFSLGLLLILSVTLLPPVGPPGVIVIDLQIQESSRTKVFWNEFDQAPLVVANPGGRRVIELPLPITTVYRLRIDPTEKPNEVVALYRVTFRLTDGTERDVPLTEISKWAFISTSKPEVVDGALTFRSTTATPYIYGPVSLPAVSLFDKLRSALQSSDRSNEIIVQLLFVGALAAFLLGMTPRWALTVAGTIALFFPALNFGPPILIGLLGPDTFDVSQAVGRAAKFGLSVEPDRLTTALLAGIALMLGLVFGKLKRAVAPDPPLRPDRKVHSRSLAREFLLAGILLLALTAFFMPDLNAAAQREMLGQFPNQWDSNNVVTWAAFVAQGKRPYIDFWYPYSGMWTFDLPLPWGPLLKLLHQAVLLAMLGLAIWRLTGGRTIICLAVVGSLALMTGTGILPAWERYFISVALVLSFVAIDRDHSLLRSGRIWFWISCILALWIEPAQLVYAAPGVLIALIYDEFGRRPFLPGATTARAARDFSIPIVCLAGFFALLAWNGEVGGFIETNYQLGLSAIYSVLPVSLPVEIRNFSNAVMIGLFAPYVFLLVAPIAIMSDSAGTTRRLYLALACVATIGVAVAQKHLVRPIGFQLLGPTVVAATLIFCAPSNYVRRRLAIALVLGAGLGCAVLNPHFRIAWQQSLLTIPQRIDATYQALVHRPSLLGDANRVAFSEDHFSEFKPELAAVRKLREMGKRSVFVFGDMPIFYLLTSGPTPFQVNFYSASPISAQVDLRDWIERTKPEAVVVDPDVFTFDEVQLVVRDPVVVQEVIKNYVPADRVGRFSLLLPRSADQPIPLQYWRELFGPKVDYGYLLRNIRSGSAVDCSQAAEACLRYLELRFSSAPSRPEEFNLPVEVGAYAFEVTFVRTPEQLSYLVPIDRLWFWRAGEEMGVAPRPQLGPSGEVTARIITTIRPIPTLY